MAYEIFYSALGGAIGGGLVVILVSVIPRTFRYLGHRCIRWKYRKTVDSIIGNWEDIGMVLLPNGREIQYDFEHARFQDREQMRFIKLLRECIIHQEWSLFRRTLLLLEKTDTLINQKYEKMREKSLEKEIALEKEREKEKREF